MRSRFQRPQFRASCASAPISTGVLAAHSWASPRFGRNCSKRHSRFPLYGVASAHRRATEMSNSRGRFRPDGRMSGLALEIKRHERRRIDTFDHEFVEQVQPLVHRALRRPASEARARLSDFDPRPRAPSTPVTLKLLEREEGLLATRNFESRHTCHSHRSMPATSLSRDHHVVSKTERTTTDTRGMEER
jgi:hypothetical protein